MYSFEGIDADIEWQVLGLSPKFVVPAIRFLQAILYTIFSLFFLAIRLDHTPPYPLFYQPGRISTERRSNRWWLISTDLKTQSCWSEHQAGHWESSQRYLQHVLVLMLWRREEASNRQKTVSRNLMVRPLIRPQDSQGGPTSSLSSACQSYQLWITFSC